MNIRVKRPVIAKKSMFMVVTILAVLGLTSVIVYASLNQFYSLEAESGTKSGNVANVTDASASAGTSVKFGETPESCPSTGAGGFPLPDLTGRANACNTGPRYECTSTHNGTFTTTSDGQVIDRMCINGNLRIDHNNVTVRDTKVMGAALYALDIGRNSATCPSGVNIEYTEIDNADAAEATWGVYQRCAAAGAGHTFDHVKIHNLGRGLMIYGNFTMTDSYVYSHQTWDGAHRTAISTHGGDNFTVTGNTFICVNLHCSSSVNMYSDYAPVTNYLLEDNLVAGGSICVRGGQTHSYPDDTHDIRILNNRFSTLYAPECGTLQALAQFDVSAPGNVRSGNVWHESGLPITGE